MAPSYAALFGARYRALMVAALGATFLGSLDALMVTTALPTAMSVMGSGTTAGTSGPDWFVVTDGGVTDTLSRK